MYRVAIELRNTTLVGYNSVETFNNPEAKMQSEEQSVSDLNSPTKSNLAGHWPPSLLRLVLGAVFAAGMGYFVLKTMNPIFVVPDEIAIFPEASPIELYQRLDKAKFEVDGKNFSIVFGVIGAVFGAICVVFSFGARSVKAIIVAVVGSATMGALGANLSNRLFNNLRETNGQDLLVWGFKLDSMWQTTLGYALLWGLIGLGVGLGIGSVRSVGKSLVAGISGLFGGVLGAMLYVVLTAQFSIGTTMNRVIPDSNTSQAIWLVFVSVVIAVCIALGSGEKRRKAAA